MPFWRIRPAIRDDCGAIRRVFRRITADPSTFALNGHAFRFGGKPNRDVVNAITGVVNANRERVNAVSVDDKP
jgi:hypothetical protein